MSRVMDFKMTGRWVKKTPKHKLFFLARVVSAHDTFILICYSSEVEHISHLHWPGSKLRFESFAWGYVPVHAMLRPVLMSGIQEIRLVRFTGCIF